MMLKEKCEKQLTAIDLIRRARKKQVEREGVRVIIRLSNEMLSRANACAREIDEPLADWCNKVCRRYQSGKFERVASCDKSLLATRESSTPTHIRAPKGMTAHDIKVAIAFGIDYCESKRIAYKIEKPARFIIAN